MQNSCIMPSGPCVPCGTSATPIYETKLLKAADGDFGYIALCFVYNNDGICKFQS
jgi:hypothetical protein